ncbi:hypothetical protein INT43_008504 [Umbelopsis isabellina]|uniref:Multiple inositol polyphosphate phosphatase 1 n=1 Tax=Mortierella isabellina TaxID=91625 RepID=A0A8H7UJ55_MORIS|nr:hypothetical protein INT43_008504 [Umbelopsis isabellina]
MVPFFRLGVLGCVFALSHSLPNSNQFPLAGPSRVDWIKQHLATKSPYDVGAIDMLKDPDNACQIVQIHSVIRHGTRWPTVKDTIDINNLVLHLSTSKSERLYWLKEWENPFTLKKAGYLHTVGQEELYQLGQRTRHRYKQLLSTIDLATDELQFASDDQSRTARSGSAFHLGFLEQYGNLTSAHIAPVAWSTYAKSQDTYIQMKRHCPRWQVEVADNPNTTLQAELWIENQLTPISARLSAEFNIDLNANHLDAIYSACAFETSFYHSESNWCQLLEAEDILALEYADDLKQYYTYGYGNEINQWVATDLMTLLLRSISSPYPPTMSFSFGHSQTVLFMLAFLGLNQDNFTLGADTHMEQIRDRKFRTSRLSSFAANIGFELWDCNGDRYIRTLVSESEVTLPGCGRSFCPFQLFNDMISRKIERNYSTICQL